MKAQALPTGAAAILKWELDAAAAGTDGWRGACVVAWDFWYSKESGAGGRPPQ